MLSLCIHGVGQSRILNGHVIDSLLRLPKERSVKSLVGREENITMRGGIPVTLLSKGINPPDANRRFSKMVEGLIEERYDPTAFRVTSKDLGKADVILSYVDEGLMKTHGRDDLLRAFQKAKEGGRVVFGPDVEKWDPEMVRKFVTERAKRIRSS